MTLFEIIEAVRNGERPDYDEIRFALLALDSIHTFTAHDLRRFATYSDEKKVRGPLGDMWIEEDFQRTKRALAKNPKEWLGWDNDPANPDYQKRRAIALKLFEKVSAKAEGKAGV